MSLTLSFIILSAAIIVFFSEEFLNLFKKIVSIPGVKLLLPLTLASWIVEYFHDWLIWFLIRFKEGVHKVLYFVAFYLPFGSSSVFVIHMLFLFLLAGLPLWIVYGIEKRHKIYDPWPYTYLVVGVLWLMVTILLTVHRP